MRSLEVVVTPLPLVTQTTASLVLYLHTTCLLPYDGNSRSKLHM